MYEAVERERVKQPKQRESSNEKSNIIIAKDDSNIKYDSGSAIQMMKSIQFQPAAQDYPGKDEDFANEVRKGRIRYHNFIVRVLRSGQTLKIYTFPKYKCQIHIHEEEGIKVASHIKSNVGNKRHPY